MTDHYNLPPERSSWIAVICLACMLIIGAALIYKFPKPRRKETTMAESREALMAYRFEQWKQAVEQHSKACLMALDANDKWTAQLEAYKVKMLYLEAGVEDRYQKWHKRELSIEAGELTD